VPEEELAGPLVGAGKGQIVVSVLVQGQPKTLP
jgi:hypothetical protein